MTFNDVKVILDICYKVFMRTLFSSKAAGKSNGARMTQKRDFDVLQIKLDVHRKQHLSKVLDRRSSTWSPRSRGSI